LVALQPDRSIKTELIRGPEYGTEVTGRRYGNRSDGNRVWKQE